MLPPVVTANSLVANPDFDKIKAGNFVHYSYELLPRTMSKYPRHDKVLSLWRQGMEERLFYPQFHGREHLNVRLWLEALHGGEQRVRTAFEYATFSVDYVNSRNRRNNFMAAFDCYDREHVEETAAIAVEGLKLFEQIHGFSSKSFIAPCYTWNDRLESAVGDHGVRYIQGIPRQKIPIPDPKSSKYKGRYHYCGQRNRANQIYLIRNCFFEPSLDNNIYGKDACLKRIKQAFSMRKPAIIGSHRLNYIGGISERNRTTNLKLLDELLGEVIQRWPQVEFMTSDEVGDLIARS